MTCPLHTNFKLTLIIFMYRRCIPSCTSAIPSSCHNFFSYAGSASRLHFFSLFLLDGHDNPQHSYTPFLPLCFSAPSLCLPLGLCESQISALSGCRLYHQLPLLTPYLTFSLRFLNNLPFYWLSTYMVCVTDTLARHSNNNWKENTSTLCDMHIQVCLNYRYINYKPDCNYSDKC